MSVIIRLQNLPWSANALDIRQYFHGLSIPEGGVHIVGGEQGDAFIAFSTDEDARQAFNRNNGKIKEVQITLMLSSRTEMQRVIEQARNQSFAAFMQPQSSQVPLPAAVPPIVPSPVPEIKKDKDRDGERKRDSKRSTRSKSRERDRDRNKDRSRDRKDSKRHRDRSRSRSRDRRERRRRDRSRSRNRSRSRDKDSRENRRSRDHNKRSDDKQGRQTANVFQRDQRKPLPEVWASDAIPVAPQPPSILGNFPVTIDQAKRTLSSLVNGLQQQTPLSNFNNGNPTRNGRDSWPPISNMQPQNQHNSRFSDNFQNKRPGRDHRDSMGNNMANNEQDSYGGRNNRIQRHDRDSSRDYRDRDHIDKDEEPVNTCVVMEPFYGGYGDLRKFFSGLFISFKGIKLINDEYGHRTGIVYVQFHNQKSKEEALRKNGHKLNKIGVTISHLDDEEFHQAIDRYNPKMDDYNKDGDYKFKSRNITKYFNSPGSNNETPELKEFTCLKIEDLPTYVKEQDILHMFSLHPLLSLHLTSRPRGGHVAYVKLSNQEVAKAALSEKSHHVIGGKPVTVIPITDEEFEVISKEHDVGLDDGKTKDIGTDCLSISNLPLKTNDRDIADFFSDIGVVPTKIHLMSNNLGFTGQAYCEFESNEDASKAARKDETSLGNATISVKPIKREEMLSILQQSLPAPGVNVQNPNPVPSSVPPNAPAVLQASPSPIGAHPRPQNLPPRPPFNQNMPPGGHGGPRPPFFGRNNFPPRGGPRFGPRMGPGGMRPRFPPHGGGGDSFEESPPGCTVYMDNVPYKAGTNEILDFFEGYNSTNNVSRRYNPNNTPSAEAKVTFHTPDDAFRAVQELNGQKIWERTIFLKQA